MRTRLHRWMLPALVLLLILAACGPAAAPDQPPAAEGSNTTPGDTNTGASASTPAGGAETDGQPVDITVWYGASVSEAGPPPDDWSVYQIARERLGMNLNLVMLPSSQTDQDTRINTAAAANDLPDVFQVSRDVWYRLVQAGLVASVDDLLPLMPERAKKHYNDEIRNKLVTVDGKMYGLPGAGKLPYTDGLVIRKDWLDKLGLSAPTTLEEFLAVAKAFTEQDPDGNGQNDTYGFGAFIDGSGLLNAGLGPRFDFIYGAYGVTGVWNVNDAEQFGLNARNPNFMEATRFIKTLVDEKVIDPDWTSLKKDEFRARWKQGKYGMMVENFCALVCLANYTDFDNNFPEGEFMVLPPPKGPNGESSEGMVVKDIRIYAISQKAIDAGKGEAIARLLEWMASDEGYFLLGFGEEGVNYKLDENGFVTVEGVPAPWSEKEQQPLTQLRNLVFINSDVELKARYITHTTQNGRTIDPLEFWKSFSEQPWTDMTGASLINPPANAADFIRYYSENLVGFILGQQPLDEENWSTYLQVLDQLGAQQLEADAKQVLITNGFLE